MAIENESKSEDELKIQTTLDGLASLAARVSHPASTMEIIGIVAPEDAETLQQQTGNSSSILTLPGKPSPT